jgi:hypothetical protein
MEVIHISQFQLAFLSLARYPSNKAFCCLRICSLFSKFCLSLAYSSSITYSAFTLLCSFRFSTRSFANSLSCFETTAVGCLLLRTLSSAAIRFCVIGSAAITLSRFVFRALIGVSRVCAGIWTWLWGVSTCALRGFTTRFRGVCGCCVWVIYVLGTPSAI